MLAIKWFRICLHWQVHLQREVHLQRQTDIPPTDRPGRFTTDTPPTHTLTWAYPHRQTPHPQTDTPPRQTWAVHHRWTPHPQTDMGISPQTPHPQTNKGCSPQTDTPPTDSQGLFATDSPLTDRYGWFTTDRPTPHQTWALHDRQTWVYPTDRGIHDCGRYMERGWGSRIIFDARGAARIAPWQGTGQRRVPHHSSQDQISAASQ